MIIPRGIAGRIRLVGEFIHGTSFVTPLARDLCITRMTLHRWLKWVDSAEEQAPGARKPPADIDQRLLSLLRSHDDRTRKFRGRLTAFVASHMEAA